MGGRGRGITCWLLMFECTGQSLLHRERRTVLSFVSVAMVGNSFQEHPLAHSVLYSEKMQSMFSSCGVESEWSRVASSSSRLIFFSLLPFHSQPNSAFWDQLTNREDISGCLKFPHRQFTEKHERKETIQKGHIPQVVLNFIFVRGVLNVPVPHYSAAVQ